MNSSFVKKLGVGMVVAFMAALIWGYGLEAPTQAKDDAAADTNFQMVLPNFPLWPNWRSRAW
jgi:hypothetical protein